MSSSGDGTILEMEIPWTKVGALIGPNGITIMELKNRFGVVMHVAQESTSPAVGRKVLQIRGPTDNVEKAKQAVIELIDSIAGEEMDIPSRKAGVLIGHRRERIEHLQNRFNVKMVVQQESGDSRIGRKSGVEVLLIRGDHANVEMARQEVLKILSSIPDSTAPRAAIYQGVESTIEVRVPSVAVGLVIGAGGDTIKRLQAETGAHMRLLPDTDPSGESRLFTVTGTEYAIQAASARIYELVMRSVQQYSELFHITVPADKAGLIIGVGGHGIKQIQTETGALVRVLEPSSHSNERIFEVKGTQEQCELVRHIIGIKTGQIAPGTPFGMQGPAPQQQIQQTTVSAAIDQHPDQSHYRAKASKFSREVITIEDDSPPRKEEPDKIVNFKEGNYDDDFPPL